MATAAEATATAENKLPEKGGTIMKYTYTARKVTLRDNFKERAEKKLDKFGKLFSFCVHMKHKSSAQRIAFS